MSIARWVLRCSAVTLTVVGCSSSPSTRYYLLETPVAPSGPSTAAALPAEAAAAAPDARGAAACRVAIGAFAVPGAVDRPQLVLRQAPNRVAILEQERWAEPLREAVPRLLEDSLRRYAAAGIILRGRGVAGADPANVQVSGEFSRFELGGRGAAIILNAVVVNLATHRAAGLTLTAEEPASQSDTAALVAAASRAVDHLGRDLAVVVATACAGP